MAVDILALFQASPWIALPFAFTSVGLSAWASGPGFRRGAIAAVVALPAVFLPFLLPSSMGVYRFMLSLIALLPVIRAFDRARERRPLSLLHRLWAATSPFETRAVTRAPRRLDRARFASSVGYALLAALAYWTAFTFAARYEGFIGLVIRWVSGAVFIYCTVDAVVGVLIVGYGLLGYVLPPMHLAPILSRSLQEFWGERWNLTMRGWFYRHCFLPLARRRQKELGVLAAFGASTIIHVWLAYVVTGVLPALGMGAFFVVQGILTVLERRIGVLGWSPFPGRVWTIVCMLCTIPLFVEPMLVGFRP